ncbi:MAG TPA: MBL fold metallo-hydrolase [Egibacteraceae bacterium]
MLEVVTIETAALGDRSYVVSDGSAALVVDPQRDIDRVLAVLDSRGLRVTHVFETHVHNDYLTGGLDLAARTGARYVVAGAEDVAFDRYPVGDGSRIEVGDLVVDVLHTPGHTPHHLSYVVGDGDVPGAVFTGGSLLYGTVGRTDLLGEALARQLTLAQHRSVRRLVEQLPDHVAVYPTHGFGSFCSSTEGSGATASTIADERRGNVAVQIDDPEAFAAALLGGLAAYPRYYALMGPRNRRGPEPIDLSPPPALDEATARDRATDDGHWVVDLRDRRAFAAAHLPGTINVAHDQQAATHLGWVLPAGHEVTLLASDDATIAAAQRDFARIGIDRPAGAAVCDPAASDGPLRSYPVADFAALAAADGVHVLDVRRRDEWDKGHLRGAQHIPFFDVPARLDEVPRDGPVWVHCASGARAAIVASLLDAADIPVVLVDDRWAHAAAAGLDITDGP